jgi:hypothetical protein
VPCGKYIREYTRALPFRALEEFLPVIVVVGDGFADDVEEVVRAEVADVLEALTKIPTWAGKPPFAVR